MSRISKNQTVSRYILVAFVFLFIFGLFTNYNPDNTDLWWNLASGRYFLETRSLPDSDPFSFSTIDQKWVIHEWLAQVILYLVFLIGDIQLLLFLKAFLITFSILFIYLSTRKGYLSLLLSIIIIPLLFIHAQVRPHLFFYLFFALSIFLLEKRHYIAMIPILLLWSNMHASVIIGLFLAFLYLGEEYLDTKKSTPILLFIFYSFISLINPNHYQQLIFPFLNQSFKDIIFEWQPPLLSAISTQVFIVLFVISLIFVVIYYSKRKKIIIQDIKYLILFAAFSYLSFSSRRNIPLFALVFVIFLSYLADGIKINLKNIGAIGAIKKISNNIVFIDYSLVILSIIFVIISIFTLSSFHFKTYDYNDGFIHFLEKNSIHGYMFNEYSLGSYIIWKLYPEYLVFIDGRNILHGREKIDFYRHIAKAQENYEEMLVTNGFSFLVLDHIMPLDKMMLNSSIYSLVYYDKLVSIYVNNSYLDSFATELFDIMALHTTSYYSSFEIDSTQSVDYYKRSIAEYEYLLRYDTDNKYHIRKLALLYAYIGDTPKSKELIVKALSMDDSVEFQSPLLKLKDMIS